MTGMFPLHRLVSWSHRLLSEVLSPGDFAVDLTAGNGADTEFLYRCVGHEGKVLSFDIQEKAIEATTERLYRLGAAVFRTPAGGEMASPGIHLVQDDHARLGEYCRDAPRGCIANLGYRPGGDRAISTEAHSSSAALKCALDLLAPGGRIAVVAYSGHEGGLAEASQIDAQMTSLPPAEWLTLRIGVPNREGSPFLLIAEKRSP